MNDSVAQRGQISRLFYEGLVQAVLNAPIPHDLFVKHEGERYFGEDARVHLPRLFRDHQIPGILKKVWEQNYLVPLFNTLLEDADLLYYKYDDFDELIHNLNNEQAAYLIQAMTRLRNESDAYFEFRKQAGLRADNDESNKRFSNQKKGISNERMAIG